MTPPRRELADQPVLWVVLAAGGVVAMALLTPLAGAAGVRAALFAGELALAGPTLLGLLLLAPASESWWATDRIDRGEVLRSFACGVALWVTSIGLFGLQTFAWPPPPAYLEAFQALHEALRPSGPIDAGLSLAAVALAPALAEELVFRGALLTSLGRRFGQPTAIVLTAIAFGSIHVDVIRGALLPHRIPFAILIGLGLATLRFRTGSLAAPMAAHAAVNALTFGAVLFGYDDTTPERATGVTGAAMLLVGGAVATVALLTPGRREDHGGRVAPM